MPVDWSTLHKVLRDETRKKIILNLRTAGTLTYTDMMNRLQITNTGKLNYHLKTLNDLVAKNDQGAYMLTEGGAAAAELLEKFPSQMSAVKTLRVSDAILLGLLGLALTLFPSYFVALALPLPSYGVALALPLPSYGVALALPIRFAYIILALVWPLLVPSYVMWRLTTKRASSHDLYELMKPPVTTAVIFYITLLLIFLIPRLLAQPSTGTQTRTENLFLFTGLDVVLIPIFPLFGVLLFEGIYRVRGHL